MAFDDIDRRRRDHDRQHPDQGVVLPILLGLMRSDAGRRPPNESTTVAATRTSTTDAIESGKDGGGGGGGDGGDGGGLKMTTNDVDIGMGGMGMDERDKDEDGRGEGKEGGDTKDDGGGRDERTAGRNDANGNIDVDGGNLRDDDVVGEGEGGGEVDAMMRDFLSFVGITDVDVASRYLEMSGYDLETAIGLFVDHNHHGDGDGVVVGAMADAAGGIGGGRGGGVGMRNDDVDDDGVGGGEGGSSKGGNDMGEGLKKNDSGAMDADDEHPTSHRGGDDGVDGANDDDEDIERRHYGGGTIATTSELVVDAALREYRAYRTLRRALSRHAMERRRLRRRRLPNVERIERGDDVKEGGTSSSTTTSDVQYHHGTRHFLFQSLLHPSLPVRRASARMILHNHHRVRERMRRHGPTKGHRGGGDDGLRDALIVLLHTLMFGEAPYQGQRHSLPGQLTSSPYTMMPQRPSMMIPRYKNQPDGGDPALQIMGMLTWLVCDGGFSNLVVCDEVRREQQRCAQRRHCNPTAAAHRNDAAATKITVQGRAGAVGDMITNEKCDDEILANTYLQESSADRGIEFFVAGGGLRWACGCIVRLVHVLVHGLPPSTPLVAAKDDSTCSGSDDAEDRDIHRNRREERGAASKEPLDDVTSRTVQTRLLLLIDLVYRLVLFGSVPSAVDQRGSLSAAMGHGDDGDVDVGGGPGREDNRGKGGGKGGWSSRGPFKFGNAEAAAADGGGRQSLRAKAGELYDCVPRSGDSAAPLLLRQPLRSSIMGNPLFATTSSGGAKRSYRGASGGGTLANLGTASSSGSGGTGGSSISNKSVMDENRRRKDHRRAALERVHNLFWSSTLPAAICVLSPASSEPTTAPAPNSHDGIVTHLSTSPMESASVEELSPLACLIAAHEILRSHPLSHSTLATNYQLRSMEKGIAILGRIVDPNASNALVVVDDELPWGLAGTLLGGESGTDRISSYDGKRVAKRDRKRGRASSHDSHRSLDSSTSALPVAGTTATKSLPPRRTDSSHAPTVGHHRAKRTRTATTTSSSVSSLLERLTRAEGGAASSISNPAARSARGEAAATSVSLLAGSSTHASRYRSAMESMIRSSTTGAVASSSATASAAAASLRYDRDGSLSRLLASARGGTSRTERLESSRPGGSHSVSTSAAFPIASTAAANRSLLRGARAMTSAEVEEWRVLHEFPEGGDVMDIDENDFSNDDDDDDDDDNDDDDDEEEEEEFVGNRNNIDVNERGESGEVEESNQENSDVDEDDDSDAESAFEEVVRHDNIDDYNDTEGNNIDEVDDDSGSEDDEIAPDGNNNYEEETDDDDEAYDTSHFDEAVINLDDIDHEYDGHHSHGLSTRNPHRPSSSRSNVTSSRLGSRVASGSECVSSGISCSPEGLSPVEYASRKRARQQRFLCAAMSILSARYPELINGGADKGKVGSQTRPGQELTSPSCTSCISMREFSIFATPCTTIITPPLLTRNAEQSLLKSLCNIVKPPRKPLNLKIFLRRAPTQEEFFRGSLNRNPIALSSVHAAVTASSGGGGIGSSGGEERRATSGGGGSSDEPLVSDLRLHIAKDLQMEDSAELLELLVANKILDMKLKLRVVHQVLWRKYVEENATSASSLGVAGAGPSHQMISTGSGLSMIFSSSGLVSARNRANASGEGSGVGSDDNTILESFPPMVVTYRLAGVDGEATEDKVELEDLEDSEAPSTANQSPAVMEQRMEKEFGITRMMLTQDKGVAVLLASVQGTISDLLQRIRRDEVARRRLLRNSADVKADIAANNEDGNTTREQFAKSPPCPGLILLRHCANISDNRKMMLANRAPTILLRILLDILNAMNRSSGTTGKRLAGRKRSSTFDFSASLIDVSPVKRVQHVEGNPTTDSLQEIIEMLASDISSEISDESKSMNFVNLTDFESCNVQQAAGVGQQDENRTLPLVLKSLHSTDLSPPLRKVIAKLLPFLTYGQVSQSKELASYFNRYVNVDRLGMMNGSEPSEEQEEQLQYDVLMNTFVESAINLPPVPVCDNLREEFISNGFVERVRCFLLEDAPCQPPSWSPALYAVSSNTLSESMSAELKEEWRFYFNRPGLSYAFRILTGLCSTHRATQLVLSDFSTDSSTGAISSSDDDDVLSLLTLCHWVESTSDNTMSNIKNPNGILAETLLDALKEDNELCAMKIDAIRKKTRDRKRELAEMRRNKALVGMSAFGKLAVGAVAGPRSASTAVSQGYSGSGVEANVVDPVSSENRSMFASMFSSLLVPSFSQPRTRASFAQGSIVASQVPQQSTVQPSWMAEMEAMADEEGITCAVCQEGRTLQPSELLGMYAYMKKVSVTSNQGGGKGDIDGTVLLLSLPVSLPNSLMSSTDMEALFAKARSAANALEGTSHALSSMRLSTSISSGGAVSSSRNNYYTTTVSAGNAIHCSCHIKAKTADRNHPKAPKSEWEGASLRNSRVTCNIVIPLVSSKTSDVPLTAVEAALADYNATVTYTLGARPKSMLWNCLHDVRFLLLRMAYGETLGADCGGGSSSSNFLLMLYQLYSADMFANNADHAESLEVSRHAKGVSAGFLVGVGILDDPCCDRIDTTMKRLERGVAVAAPMAALLSILFYNAEDTLIGGSSTTTHDLCGSNVRQTPSPSRQWEVYKSRFLAGLLRNAGHMHSLGVTDSGCVTSRGICTGQKKIERARLYKDWTSDDPEFSEVSAISSSEGRHSSHRMTMIEVYSGALRPMITLYAVLDQLSKDFIVDNCDLKTSESSERLALTLDSCYKANDIHELLRIADIGLGNDAICKYFEKGATS